MLRARAGVGPAALPTRSLAAPLQVCRKDSLVARLVEEGYGRPRGRLFS